MCMDNSEDGGKGLFIVRVIHTVQIIIINICFTKATHLGMDNYTKFLKYFFSPQGPQNRVLNFEMMP